MTTTVRVPTTATDHERCGCCGRSLPTNRVTELGRTPGVYICAGCALWAARRASRVPILRIRPRQLLHRLTSRGDHHHGDQVLGVTAVLATSDLDRTIAYYRPLGFELVEKYDANYLLLHAGSIELHFSTGHGSPEPGLVFVHVPDAGRLWKELMGNDMTGLGPVEDQPWGLREFIATDPDGNRVRIGSHAPND